MASKTCKQMMEMKLKQWRSEIVTAEHKQKARDLLDKAKKCNIFDGLPEYHNLMLEICETEIGCRLQEPTWRISAVLTAFDRRFREYGL